MEEVFGTSKSNLLSRKGIYSLPGLAWDAALKMSGVELELLTDIDKYIFLELGMRGRPLTTTVFYPPFITNYIL